MTKLKKVGLIMAIVSAILWILGLICGLYSSMGKNNQISAIQAEQILNSNTSVMDEVSYIVYFVLIVVFAIGIGFMLEGYLKKSLLRSLVILIVSCLIGWLFRSLSYWFYGTLCGGCEDYIAYSLGIFFLLFFILWFISLFYVIKYLTSSNKWSFVGVLIVVSLLGALFLQTNMGCQYLWGCLTKSVSMLFLCFLIISIILCVIAGIKSYKERKKSS